MRLYRFVFRLLAWFFVVLGVLMIIFGVIDLYLDQDIYQTMLTMGPLMLLIGYWAIRERFFLR